MQRAFVILLLFFATTSSFVHAQASDELVDTVVGFLSDSDQEIRAIAFEQIRNDVKGSDATKTFAAQLPSLEEGARLGLLRALGERGDAAAKPAITEFVSTGNSDAIRVAAVGAIGKLGNADDTSALVKLIAEEGRVADAARQALVSLPGTAVSKQIVNEIGKAPVAQRVTLIEVLTDRRAKEAIPALLRLATGKTAALRVAAMKCLGQLADQEHVPGLAKAVLVATPGNERNDAERNLMRVCNRMEDKDKRADPLLAAMRGLSRIQRTAMLPALGRIGGEPALVEIETAINSRDEATHMAGIRGISNWPDASVAQRLIDLAKTDKHPDHRRIARMTILRVAPLPDGRTDDDKLALLKTGMKLASTDSEKNYGLKRAAPIRLVETLRFVLPYVDQPKYSGQACRSIVELAHDRKLRDDNKAEFHAALNKVIATTKDPVLVDRANRYKRGQTWVRPKNK